MQTLQGAEFDGTTRMPVAHAVIHRAALLFHHARQLVPEKRGRLDHARMRSLLPHFQVRAAGERDFHAHQYFVFGE